MICPGCGGQVPEGSYQCPFCGAPLPRDSAQPGNLAQGFQGVQAPYGPQNQNPNIPGNPYGDMPGVAEASSGFNPASSDFFYENSWYLRLDNISIGYTFPSKLFKDKIKNLRLYAAARNIAVFTPYKGMDPETGNGIGAYPNNFSVAVGLDLKF